MTTIAAKQFVRPLSDQGYFDVLAGPLADEIHRNNRGGGDRLFQRCNDLRERLLEDRSGNRDGCVLRSQYASGFRGIRSIHRRQRSSRILRCRSANYLPLRFIKASSSPESTPPLKSKPTGTSLMSCRRTACL